MNSFSAFLLALTTAARLDEVRDEPASAANG
jgi:hypothetical protein